MRVAERKGSALMKSLRFETSVTVTTTAAPMSIVYETVTDLRSHLIWSGDRAR